MKHHRYLLGVITGLVFLYLSACVHEVVDQTEPVNEFPDLVEDVGGKADTGKASPARLDVLKSMRARYSDLRYFKAKLSLGENLKGYVEIPPLPQVQQNVGAMSDEEVTIQDVLIAAENTDRARYYDLLMEEHTASVQEQVNNQEPAIRAQVIEKLCAQLQESEPCEAIADAVIQEALSVALEVAIKEALAAIRIELEAIHGAFWQKRTCRSGEWVEIKAGAGDVWRAK